MGVFVTGIQASADSQMFDQTPNTNYGSDLDWDIGLGVLTPSIEIFRSILKFPLNSIPASHIILKAMMTITCRAGADTAEPAEVRNVIGVGVGSPGWVEAEVTWNSARTLQNWVSFGGDSDSLSKVAFVLPTSTGPRTLNVSALLRLQRDTRDQANFNVILKRTNEATVSSKASFHSRVAVSVPHRPVLNITHSSTGVAVLHQLM